MTDVKKFADNFIWKFLERCGSQAISLLVSIILARLIEPSMFGVMSMIYVFTSIMNVFVDSGMGIALIQKKDADNLDFSSVFYFNVVFGILLYILMFVSAPFIADFFEMPELTPILRVTSLVLVISGLRNVQQSYVSREMIFKRFFYATLGGTLTSAIISVVMAYHGFGVWALVAQTISSIGISTIILWVSVKWRPEFIFSFRRLKSLINYGWKLLGASLLEITYENMRALIIGKLYKPSDLAYFNMGQQLPYAVVNNINTSIDSVLLPTVSAEQDEKDQVKRILRRAIVTSTYIIFPFMLGLAAMADSVVSILLTDKWSFCVPFLRIFCLVFMFYPVNSSNLNVIKALGRSDIILKLEMTKKIISISLILITMWISPLAIAMGSLIGAFVCQILNTWPNKKLLGYSYIDQIRDILPNLILASIMAVAIYLVSFLGLSMVATFCLQIVAGLTIYPLLSKMFGVNSFEYILDIAKMYIKRK